MFSATWIVVREALQLQHTARRRAVKLPPFRPVQTPSVLMRFKQLPLIPIVLVLAACSPSNGNEKGGKGHGPMGGMPPASEVTVMTAAVQSMPVTFEYVGQTAGSREVEVRARVTGILLSRNFKEGQRVTK